MSSMFKKNSLINKKPWFNNECKDILEKRNKVKQEMIQNPTLENLENYQKLRKIVRK